MTPALLGLALALAAGQAAAAQSAQTGDPGATVEARVLHLRGLDNLNGTAQDIDMTVGETTRFGQLEITAEDCRVPRDTPRPTPSPSSGSATSARTRRASPAGCSPPRRRSPRSTTRATTSGC